VRPLAPLIAVVGSDGSGKTTVSSAVLDFVRRYGAAESAYLGMKSGDVGRMIKALPLIGPTAEAYAQRKATQARNKKDKMPGPFTALIIYGFSLIRMARFRRMLRRRRAGHIIVTDRYPQIDVPGFYDGPGLSAARADSWFTRWLAKREYSQYAWMASHKPDLIVRLNVDVKTAFDRKPDHAIDLLAQKVAVTRELTFGGAPIVDLDSREPLETVLRKVQVAVGGKLSALGFKPQG
jgi:thymidylate kinase